MERKSLTLLIVLLFLCSVAYGQSYKMRFNPFTGKGDWVVDLIHSVPTTPTDVCTAGNFSYDADYFYVCISSNTWERTAIATWVSVEYYLLIDATHYLLIDATHKLRIQ